MLMPGDIVCRSNICTGCFCFSHANMALDNQVVCSRWVAVKEDRTVIHEGMRDYDKNAIILMTLSDYVNTVSRTHQCLPEEGQLVSLTPVWHTLWRYVGTALDCINASMKNSSYRSKSTALFRITDLTATEVRLLDSLLVQLMLIFRIVSTAWNGLATSHPRILCTDTTRRGIPPTRPAVSVLTGLSELDAKVC